MKTAISLSDQLYKEAEKTAKSMGIPRSQLYAKALEAFLDHHTQKNVTGKLNEIYGNTGTKSDFVNTEAARLEALRELTKNDTW